MVAQNIKETNANLASTFNNVNADKSTKVGLGLTLHAVTQKMLLLCTEINNRKYIIG